MANDDTFRAWRRLKGFTQGQAAEYLNYALSSVKPWESGQRPIPARIMEQVEAELLAMPDDDFIADGTIKVTVTDLGGFIDPAGRFPEPEFVQRYWCTPDCQIVRQPYAMVPADAYDPERWPMKDSDGKPTGQFWQVMTDGERAWKVAPEGVPTHIPAKLPDDMASSAKAWVSSEDKGKPVYKVKRVYRGGPIPRGMKIVRVCRSQTEPKGQPWAKGVQAE